MSKKTKGIIAGAIIGIIIIGSSLAAVAAGTTTTLYNVINSGIHIVIDGQEFLPTDANGKKVEPLIYNGTTYLPVRAISNAFGKAVYWDGPNYTVYLGDMGGTLQHPTVMMTDLKSISETPATTSRLTDNYGNKYSSAVYNYGTYGLWTPDHLEYEYLLAGKYSRFKGTLYIPEGETASNSVGLSINADGRVIYESPKMTKGSAPVAIDVDVSGYNDVIITWHGSSDDSWGEYLDCCLADAGFYQ